MKQFNYYNSRVKNKRSFSAFLSSSTHMQKLNFNSFILLFSRNVVHAPNFRVTLLYKLVTYMGRAAALSISPHYNCFHAEIKFISSTAVYRQNLKPNTCCL